MSTAVAEKRKPVAPKPEPKTGRFELKAERSWLDRVKETADAMGMDVSNYIRFCVNEHMVDDRRKYSLEDDND